LFAARLIEWLTGAALEVGDLRQRGVGAGQNRCHRQHGRDAERHARRRSVTVQPEFLVVGGLSQPDVARSRRHSTPSSVLVMGDIGHVAVTCLHVTVQPERDPRQDDDETRRNVDVNNVVAETTNEIKLARQPRVIAYNVYNQSYIISAVTLILRVFYTDYK